ncbi:MAG: hypothetical protein M1823_003306 [Watsoniomyces obsoletus]|nr:MAG: hypothetical protein M1823_003306 [Watsoniomyces obsoletus]
MISDVVYDMTSRVNIAEQEHVTSDDYLLTKLARVVHPNDLDVIRHALQRCQYRRYHLPGAVEREVRKLVDAWWRLEWTMQQVVDRGHPQQSLLSSRLDIDMALAARLSTEVVMIIAGCVPWGPWTRSTNEAESCRRRSQDQRAQDVLSQVVQHPYRPVLMGEMKTVIQRLQYGMACRENWDMLNRIDGSRHAMTGMTGMTSMGQQDELGKHIPTSVRAVTHGTSRRDVKREMNNERDENDAGASIEN